MQLPDFSDLPKCPYKSHCCERIMPIWAMLTKTPATTRIYKQNKRQKIRMKRVSFAFAVGGEITKVPLGNESVIIYGTG